jgi:hypothetical protein
VRTNSTTFLATISAFKIRRSSRRSPLSQLIAISLNRHYYWQNEPIRLPAENELRQYDDFSPQDGLDKDWN